MQEIDNLDQLTEQQLLELLPEPKAPNIISQWDIVLLVGSCIVVLIGILFVIWQLNRAIKRRRQQQQTPPTSQLALQQWQQLSEEDASCQQRITRANELIRTGLPKTQQSLFGSEYANVITAYCSVLSKETIQALTIGVYQHDYQLAEPKQFHQQISQLLIELPWNT